MLNLNAYLTCLDVGTPLWNPCFMLIFFLIYSLSLFFCTLKKISMILLMTLSFEGPIKTEAQNFYNRFSSYVGTIFH